VQRVFGAETPEYFLLLATTLFLVAFGVVMVASSSAVESFVDEGDFFGQAKRQGLYALIGVPVMLLAARAPITFWKRWGWHAIIVAIGLQALVIFSPLGVGNGFNKNWIQLGSFTAQPSEVVKLALVIWLAQILVAKQAVITQWRQLLLPIVPVAGGAIVLVLAGGDLGTVIILFLLVMGALYFAGARALHLTVVTVLAGAAGVAAMLASDSRRKRVEAWLGGCSDPDLAGNDCYQTLHGWQALAHGGVFGVGLGNSSGKWLWLPEADNDFIFAIIGEELGLVGCVLVLALLVVLTIALVRVARRARDPFAKIATGAVTVWIIGQALVNIGVVLGLLPVLGVPLPLVSAGGSALITSLAGIGIVLSFARTRSAGSGADFSPPPRRQSQRPSRPSAPEAGHGQRIR